MHFRKLGSQIHKCWHPRQQSSWGQYGAHLGPVGPRWAPCWPHEPCYQGLAVWLAIRTSWHGEKSLRWRHNGRDSVSNHQPHDCLLNADQRKHQSSASLAFVRRIHRRPVNSPHKWPVTRKMFSFDDVIMVPHYKPFARGFIRLPMKLFGSPHIGPVIQSFVASSVVGVDKPLDIQPGCQWYEMPWRARDVRVNSYFYIQNKPEAALNGLVNCDLL